MTVEAEVLVDDLGFDIEKALPWFLRQQETPYVLIRVTDEHAKVRQD